MLAASWEEVSIFCGLALWLSLLRTGVPGLEEDDSSLVMHRLRDLSPGLGVVIGNHKGRPFPVTAGPVNEKCPRSR